ncbi:hypothetical protein AMS68_004463 [Peltaster fructicola]|uniref:1,3-beta-glucanosyltransferase n=1 Tax=Peltaster fructicola TaxID=286661 RepID=A0A6H0XW85_9PEZI|nr:hypothetical protein AMS68_004463 [Peltaster fructicola]
MSRALLLSAIYALTARVAAVTPATISGQEFFVGSDRLQLLGIDYQPGGQSGYGASNTQDPLSNGTICLRDAALMQSMGVNVIRSYNVDPTLNHDLCASIFNAAGIYIILDVNSPLAGQSIDRSAPANSYNVGYLSHIFQVVEAFKSYDNVLGFFAGNEVINDIPTAKDNPRYIRAVQRDLKNYIAKHASRAIPVGYSAADVRSILQDTWAYFQCDNGDNSGSDFFGLNSYSWCGSASSFQTAQYDQLVSFFSNSSIPVFFSEYGCNKPSPRVFDEVAAIYGPLMTALSGGLVYEWTQDTDNYGLVNAYSNGSLQLRPDFVALNAQYAKIDTSLITSGNSSATSIKPPKCSSGLISSDGFGTNFNVPSAPDGADQLISAGVSSAQTGSFVSVTQTAVQLPVYDVSGAAITGLAIKSISGANKPGNVAAISTGGGSSSGTAAAAAATTASTSTKSGAAIRAVATNGAALGAAVAMAAFAL